MYRRKFLELDQDKNYFNYNDLYSEEINKLDIHKNFFDFYPDEYDTNYIFNTDKVITQIITNLGYSIFLLNDKTSTFK